MAHSEAAVDTMTLGLAGVGGHTSAWASASEFTVSVSHCIDEVEQTWRALATSVESPGQDFDFVRQWAQAFETPEDDQYFVTAWLDGEPLAFMPLKRRNVGGIRVLSWFAGSHVGANAPLLDRERLETLTPHQRRTLWLAMTEAVQDVDIVSLKYLPADPIFAELGERLEADIVYRSHFLSWDEANTTQRSKSRRKHDRQQGDRLDALGTVTFEEIGSGPDALAVLDVMFRQRAARFVKMGVRDPFACEKTRAFYDATVAPGSRVPVKLHVLRLNGEIVAVRYNIAHGDRLFCLISSMSEDEAIQVGSPGKQCLLRVMQTVFDAGYRVFDMGVGFTDEKRHWCNEQIAVGHHYLPLTIRGWIAAKAHKGWHSARHAIKSNTRLRNLVQSLRKSAKPAPASE